MNDSTESAENPDAQADAGESEALREFRIELNHKIRTPLNAILGFAELLALQPGSTRKDADVHQILKSARDLLAIVESELAEPDPRVTRSRGDTPAATRACDILYVEDDPVNFALVERILEYRPGVGVLNAPEGHLAVGLAEAYKPRLILLDLNLPDMHGSEVLRRLQNCPATAGIPAVVLSADATPSQIERLLTAGAKNYLTKPFNIEQFLAVVDDYLEVATPAT